MPALLLVVFSLLLMLARVAAPFGRAPLGRPLLTVRLGLPERVLYHRSGLYAFGAILLLVSVGGLLSTPFLLLAVLACYGVLTVPVRYRLTSDGIGVNTVVFRRWSEFGAVDANARAITLRGTPGSGRFTVRLLAAHQSDALAVIRRHVAAAGAPARERGKRGRPVRTEG